MASITVLHNEDWKSEIAVGENTTKFNPFAFKVYNNLGAAYFKKGELDKAEANLKKCLEIKPDTGMAYFNLYRIYKAKGNNDEANRCLKRARQLDPVRVNVILQKMGISEYK